MGRLSAEHDKAKLNLVFGDVMAYGQAERALMMAAALECKLASVEPVTSLVADCLREGVRSPDFKAPTTARNAVVEMDELLVRRAPSR